MRTRRTLERMHLTLLLAATIFAGSRGLSQVHQTPSVALTIDDLPFATVDDRPMLSEDIKAAKAANRKLLRVLKQHRVPVTGFVIQRKVEELGSTDGTGILRSWVKDGLDLGNHTYGHPNFTDIGVDQFEDQIIRGESTILPLMSEAGRKAGFFRFPYNHTGDTKQKHDLVARFLAERGYRLAPCTIENSDWMFNNAYARMRARHDRGSAAKLRVDYLAFTSAQLDYFGKLDQQVWGYEPPQIMLIHDNQLNSDVINELLVLFERKQYRWITLSEAESDPAYNSADTFISKYGPMWGYRWAQERNVKIDGNLEPDPPQWITEYLQLAARRSRAVSK